jgi:beta-galactosidase
LNFRFYAATTTGWCKAGHEVGWDQVSIPVRTGKTARSKTTGRGGKPLTLNERNGIFAVGNDAFHLVVSRDAGLIEAWRWGELDILTSGPKLQIWRGPTDNDGIKSWPERWRPLNKWRLQGLDKLAVKTVSAKARRNKDGSITLSFEHLGTCAASDRAVRHQHGYTVFPDGRIEVDNIFTIDKAIPDLPRLGVVLTLKPGFENLK